MAPQNTVATQICTRIHLQDNFLRTAEWVHENVTGHIWEVHVWSGSNYSGRQLNAAKAAPKHVDRILSGGSIVTRPYCETMGHDRSSQLVHRFGWRWSWDSRTDRLGDFGYHYMDFAS